MNHTSVIIAWFDLPHLLGYIGEVATRNIPPAIATMTMADHFNYKTIGGDEARASLRSYDHSGSFPG